MCCFVFDYPCAHEVGDISSIFVLSSCAAYYPVTRQHAIAHIWLALVVFHHKHVPPMIRRLLLDLFVLSVYRGRRAHACILAYS